MGRVKHVLRAVTPASARRLRHRRALKHAAALSSTHSNAQLFSLIYRNQEWGGGNDDGFDSGDGTRDRLITDPYVAAVTTFLSALPAPPDVVDLGCGDFTVGQRVRPFCGAYTACDVVPELVQRNSHRFADADVDFRVVDIVADDLPVGEVVFVRQVFQHLSNDSIARVLPKLSAFRYAVVTEHLPLRSFTPNVDMPTGAHIRLGLSSGTVLTAAPFSWAPRDERVLCEVRTGASLVRTMLYTL